MCNHVLRLFVFSILVLLPFSVHSHVRWFVESNTISGIEFAFTSIYYLLIGLAVFYAVIAIWLERLVAKTLFEQRKYVWFYIPPWRFLAWVCGVTLIVISFEKVFVAPNIHLAVNRDHFLIVQSICGVFLISALRPNISGFAFIVLCALAIYLVDFRLWIDYVPEFCAIGLAMILHRAYPQAALTILRLGLGAQLMILAVHNKLIEPELGLRFLEQYHWNFMQMMGLQYFDNLLFVFSAGIAEFTFGLLIFTGMGASVALLSVGFFFVLTSTMLGLDELIGHLPIIASVVILLTLGGGHLPRFALPSRSPIWAQRLVSVLNAERFPVS